MERKPAEAVERRSSEHSNLFLQMFRRNRTDLADSIRGDENRARRRTKLGMIVTAAGIAAALSACGTNIEQTYVVNNPAYCDPTRAGNSIVNSTLPKGIPPCPILGPETTISESTAQEITSTRVSERKMLWKPIGEGAVGAAGAGIVGRQIYKRNKRRPS